MWCAVSVTFKGDGGHGDDRTLGEPLFQIVVFRLTFSQAQPPTVIMDDDTDMVRVVERGRAAIERGVVEVPFWRSRLPDELGKIAPVGVVAGSAAVRGEIILVPPLELGGWRQRHPVGFGAADQIATHGDHGLAALGPERGDDVGRPRSPVETGNDRLVDLESIHQRDGVSSKHRLLAIPERLAREKACRPIATQIRHDHPIARRRQQRRDLDEAVDVVGPAVQQQHGRAVGRAGLGIADVQDTGINLLQFAEVGHVVSSVVLRSALPRVP